ncbi:hypothetical protein EV127DRAFT_8993 [Xylaria flabelliformis]|nr:hypothetical protein EV127DRAFT_8993 [Xylaria flabelliformis]
MACTDYFTLILTLSATTYLVSCHLSGTQRLKLELAPVILRTFTCPLTKSRFCTQTSERPSQLPSFPQPIASISVTMKLINLLFGAELTKVAILVSAAISGNPRLVSRGIITGTTARLPRFLEKRDAYTCYGSDANVTDCQAALDQLQALKDQNFEVYSGICLNWAQDTCNVRFCAQPYVAKTVNRTASWIYNWANNSLMDCVRGGQYSVMGDSTNLNGDGGTYRLHLENATPRHG